MKDDRQMPRIAPVNSRERAETVRDMLLERRADSFLNGRWSDLAALETIDFWRDRARGARAALIATLVVAMLTAALFLSRSATPEPDPMTSTYSCKLVKGSADLLKCWPTDRTDDAG